MKAWLKWLIIIVVAGGVLYGAAVAYAEYSNGTNVNVTFRLGHNADGTMYLKCDQSATTAGVCADGDQATVTVHKRDRVTFNLVNDDGAGHTHDFKLLGWQYTWPPISPEMELQSAKESWTFTAWAAGSYRIVCELPGHDTAGMHATFVVK